MKKAVLFFGLVIAGSILTSCTTDDLDQNISNSNIQFEEEINQSFYEKDSDTIVKVNINVSTETNSTDPIVIPKKD